MADLENNGFSIGNLLKQLRKRRGLTQKELSDRIGYGVRQIIRFENDKVDINDEVADILSRFYNIDLNAYLSVEKKFDNPDSYEKYVNLRSIIENNGLSKLEEEYNKLCNNPDFMHGEQLQLMLYCKGLILTHNYGNYKESIKMCFRALEVYNYNDYINSLRNDVLTEMTYPLLFLLGYNYCQLDENDRYFELTEELYNHFTNFVFNTSVPLKSDMYHMKKYYTVSTNNLAHVYFDLKDYNKSLELINEAIDLSNKFRINLHIHYFIMLKSEIFYMLGDIENAKKFYNIFEYVCEINGRVEYFNSVQEELRSKYSKMFET